MKKYLVLYFFIVTQSLSAQSNDSIAFFRNSTYSSVTTNSLLSPHNNFETINNSFITGSAIPFLRNQNNPLITIDGIPANPTLLVNLPHKEFIGYPHLLSYDVEALGVNAFSTDSKIVSGRFSNSVSLGTKDISSKGEAMKFFVNNFSSINYQRSDTLGFSIINNAGVEKSGERISYRVSLTNGYHNVFIPNNGLKRNSANLKLQFRPIKNTTVTGFVDYSSFRDYKRAVTDYFNADRLFTYLSLNSQLSKRLEIYARASIYNSNDDMGFELREEHVYQPYPTQTPWSETLYYTYNADYINRSTYYDGGFRLNFLKHPKAQSTFEIGYNRQEIEEQNAIMNYDERLPNGSYSRSSAETKLATTENKYYGNITLDHRIASFKYLMDLTTFEFVPLQTSSEGKSTYPNHKVNTILRIYKRTTGNLNDVELKLTYARINNISLAPNRNNTLLPQLKKIWINRNVSDNYEISLNTFVFKKKLKFDFACYWNNLNDYHDTHYQRHMDFYSYEYEYFGESIRWGDLKKSGIELSSQLSVIERTDLSWMMQASFSKNVIKFSSLYFWPGDSNESNVFFTIGNKFRYKNILFQFLVEGKEGLDFDYYNRSIGSTYPVPRPQYYSNLIDTHNSGKAIYDKSVSYAPPHTKYFMLKNIALRYNLKIKKRRIDEFTIGLTYDRIRNIFLHLNDISSQYSTRAIQTPSTYNTLSLSTGITF
jgi:hypothetical protein